jgi:excisionase family DNA binding protein
MGSKESEILKIEEAAALLAIKPSRLRTAVFRREIPFFKLGGLVRFNRSELLAWVKSRTVKVQ